MTNNFQQVGITRNEPMFLCAVGVGTDIIHRIKPKRFPSEIDHNRTVIGDYKVKNEGDWKGLILNR